jgi:hypothetical protein
MCQNVEAQALLTALKQQWSDECEVLLKEREDAITKKYKDELSYYRSEVRDALMCSLYCENPKL